MGPVARGAFQLLEPVGQGGMGQVWRGIHTAHGLPVAVKVVTAEKAREAGFRARFRHEVQSVARLHHLGIVRVFDLGEVTAGAEEASGGQLVAGGPFLAMAWVAGGWLSPLWRPTTRLELALRHGQQLGMAHRAAAVPGAG